MTDGSDDHNLARDMIEVPLPRPSQFWLVFFVLAAAVLVSAIVHGGFMFGIGIP
jgi:hypothetical protein